MSARRIQLPAGSFADFGPLLRVLRRAARLTQRDLGIAVGYSEAQISRLEQGKRLPDPAVVAALFVPSLGLAGEPELAGRLYALARDARDARDGRDREDAQNGRDGGERPVPGPTDDDQPRGGATGPDDLAAIPAAPRPWVDRAATAARH